MPDINMATHDMVRSGLDLDTLYRTAWDPNDRYLFPNTGHEFLLIKQAAGTSTVTVLTYATQDGLAVADQLIDMATDTEQVSGMFTNRVKAIYEEDGQIVFTTSGTGLTGLSIAVIRVDLNN